MKPIKKKTAFAAALALAASCALFSSAVMAEGGVRDPLEEAQKKADKIVKETPPPFDAASLQGTILDIYLEDPKSKKTLKSYAGLMKIESKEDHHMKREDPGRPSSLRDVGYYVSYRFKVRERTDDIVSCCFPGDICNDCWTRRSALENIQGEAFEFKIRFLNNLVTDIALEREGEKERDHYGLDWEERLSLFPMDIKRLISLEGIPMKHSIGTVDPKTHWTHWKDEEPVVMVLNRD